MSANVRQARIPRATYRLQFNHLFTFNDATRIVPYLAALGVSHIYASPILKARPGSMHGYDVTDHNALNPELGTREDLDRLVDALHAHDMGLIVDIVPNHLGVMGEDNVWWLDVLENGPAARYAPYFDIDWRPERASMRDRVLVPVLGDSYGAVLERGELKLKFDEVTGSFAVRYHEHLMPIDPREYPRIFTRPIADELLAPDDPHRGDFESLMNGFGSLPPRDDTSEEAIAIRYRDKEAHKRRLVRMIDRSPEILQHIVATIDALNGTPGAPESFDALEALLEAQAYRLSYWRVAVDEINYRRFFDVNDLAALRMNERGVFDSTHQLIFELVEQGAIDGLRIDHSDGLYDPEEYFLRLQQRFGWDGQQEKPLYVVTEKILAAHERLPEAWLVHGTTGYEFAALSTSWLVCGDDEARMTRRYRQFTESEQSFDEIAYQGKRLVMRASLAAEVEVLTTQLDRIAHLDRHTADYTRAALREAIREVIACFPIYRTYISLRGSSEEDRRIIRWAASVAQKRSAGVELSVFDFLRDVLLGDSGVQRPPAHRQAMLEFAMKFQQVTSPVTAKGVEDTAFYRYSRLVCLNEVGGDPRRFGVSSNALHQANLERSKSWPHSILTTSTHDTKRSEDVRARIAVLSELPEQWKRHLARWARLNRSKRRIIDDRPAPDREDEYLLYQTLVGVWAAEDAPSLPCQSTSMCGLSGRHIHVPAFADLRVGSPPGDRGRGSQASSLVERLQAYAVKAAREAKRSTSWVSPNAEYEKALCEFVAQLLENPERNAFLHDFAAFAAAAAFFGRINSLVQVVLKICSPGVADFYQGTELPSFTLVDPDNRQPVDFEHAAQQLEALTGSSGALSLADANSAALAKLHVTTTLLQLRRRDPELFSRGSYQPLQVDGDRKEHVFAFARALENRSCIVVVPRWTAKLMDGFTDPPRGSAVWSETRITVGSCASATMTEMLSGAKVQFEGLGSESSITAETAFREFRAVRWAERTG